MSPAALARLRAARHGLPTQWTQWSERTGIAARTSPGVYVLARFGPRSVPERVDPMDQRVVYIGETCATLERRWYQFNRSAFLALPGHSGGWTYAAEVGGTDERLYVAAVGFNAAEAGHDLAIRALERMMILEYFAHWGRPPACNRK